MPLNIYSLAKKLVGSTALPQNASHPRHMETLDRSVSQLSPQSDTSHSAQSIQNSSSQSTENTRGENGKSSVDKQFLRWVNKLHGQVQSLESRIPSEDIGKLEREANTCKAELQNLYDYATTQEVNLEGCYNQLVGIRERLQFIDTELRNKKDLIAESKRPTWIKVINVVLHTISIVADILGLAPLGGILRTAQQLLPSGKDIKFLK